jgi:hypothetical protein
MVHRLVFYAKRQRDEKNDDKWRRYLPREECHEPEKGKGVRPPEKQRTVNGASPKAGHDKSVLHDPAGYSRNRSCRVDEGKMFIAFLLLLLLLLRGRFHRLVIGSFSRQTI